MIQAADLKPGDIRQLSVANEAVVPTGKIGRVEVPGRMNET
jgi:cytochrome c oxidase subunit II